MRKMIDHYSSRYGVTQTPVARPPEDPWFEQVQMIKKKLVNKVHLLRRIGATQNRMEPTIAKKVAQTMTVSIAIGNSEIWQLGPPTQTRKSIAEIQTIFNTIYSNILGSERNSCSSAVMHELGVNCFNDRVQLAALKFRNHICL